MTCLNCGTHAEASAQFCSTCGRRLAIYATPAARERLVRPREGRMIAGVCAAFALRYGWDAAIVRLVLVLAIVLGVGMPILGYLIAWVVIPNAPLALPPSVPVATTGATGPGSMAV